MLSNGPVGLLVRNTVIVIAPLFFTILTDSFSALNIPTIDQIQII